MHRRSIVAAIIAVVVPVMTSLDAPGGSDDYSNNAAKADMSITGQDSLRTSNRGGDCLKASVVKVPADLLGSGWASPGAPVSPAPAVMFSPVNAEVRPGGIYVKVAGGDGVEDSGAVSGPVPLPAALTMIATERTTYRYVGWQASDRLGRVSDLLAGLAITSGGMAEVRERGRYVIDVPYHTGDVFTIALTPTWIRYLRNGLEFSSHRVSLAGSLRAAFYLLSQGATLGPVCVTR
jgi:hypothetical protein